MSNFENEEKNTENRKNYEFSSEAVDTLANADNEPIPQYPEEELTKYRKKKFQIPNLAKVLIVKAWFAGAMFYFVQMGLGWLIGPGENLHLISVMVFGMVTDLLTNNVIRFMEPYNGANDKWILINKRGVTGLCMNVLFCGVIYFLVFVTYILLENIIGLVIGRAGEFYIVQEPILFGIFCMGIDLALIGIKNLCISIFEDAKASARGQSQDET